MTAPLIGPAHPSQSPRVLPGTSGGPLRQGVSKFGVALLVLSVGGSILLGAALVSPWYIFSYEDSRNAVEQSGSTTNFLTYKVVVNRGNPTEISYVDDSQFTQTAGLWRAVDLLVVLTLVLFLLQAAVAVLAMLRKLGPLIPTLLTIGVVIVALLTPIYVLVALPLALSEDSNGNIGNLDSPPTPATSFAGSRSETGHSVNWGPTGGWFLAMIAGGISVACPLAARKIPKPLPRAVVRGRGFTPLQQAATTYSNTPADPMVALRPGIGPAPARSGPIAPAATGTALPLELPPLTAVAAPNANAPRQPPAAQSHIGAPPRPPPGAPMGRGPSPPPPPPPPKAAAPPPPPPQGWAPQQSSPVQQQVGNGPPRPPWPAAPPAPPPPAPTPVSAPGGPWPRSPPPAGTPQVQGGPTSAAPQADATLPPGPPVPRPPSR